jgi:hypothetical protein
MTPKVVVMRLRQGTLDTRGGKLVSAIYLQEADTTPIPDINFDITPLPATPQGEARFRVDLSKENVQRIVERARAPSSQVTVAARAQRVVYYTWSFQTSTGERRPLYYGPLVIQLGASGG